MWSVPPREAPDERCDRLMAVYDRQIEDLEASRHTPYWDGYCGLVKVCDEEWVRPPVSQQTAAQHRQQQQQQPGSSSGMAAAPAAASSAAAAALGRKRPGGSVEGSALGAGTPAAATPLGGSPIGGSPASSPFKPGPGLRQSAAMLAEQASRQLAQGQLREAESLLHAALHACALSDTPTAGQIIDLLLEAERLAQETPTCTPKHSRNSSRTDFEAVAAAAAMPPLGGPPPVGPGGDDGGSSAAVGDVAPLLRDAISELAAGRGRRAEEVLLRAAAACPPNLSQLRRRVELFLELVQCKRR